MVRICVVLCAAVSLWGGTLGNVDSRPNPLLAFDSSPADYSFRDPLSWPRPAEFRPCTFETCSELTLSAGPLQSHESQDAYNLARDAEASPKNSVALGITALLIAFFLRKHFLEHGYCRECEDLREHLLIASRNSPLVAVRHLPGLHSSWEAQFHLLESAWRDRSSRQLDFKEHEDLCEHLAIASRHLDFAREAAPFTERASAMHEIRRRQRNLDALATAFMQSRQARVARRQLQLREREDLREHLLLARRRLVLARQEAAGREIALLTAAYAAHCQTHQTQPERQYEGGYYAAHPESA